MHCLDRQGGESSSANAQQAQLSHWASDRQAAQSDPAPEQLGRGSNAAVEVADSLVEDGVQGVTGSLVKDGVQGVTDSLAEDGVQEVTDSLVKDGVQGVAPENSTRASQSSVDGWYSQAAADRTEAESAEDGTEKALGEGMTELAADDTGEVADGVATEPVGKGVDVIADALVSLKQEIRSLQTTCRSLFLHADAIMHQATALRNDDHRYVARRRRLLVPCTDNISM